MEPLKHMELPKPIHLVLNRLNEHGYEAYVVGGCVRDVLLGKVPHDFDVASSAIPEEVKRIFRDYRIVEVGAVHGTILVVIDHMPIEITTFRKEGKYRDHRWPETVTFSTSLKEDMERRDFTINSLAYHPKTGFIDYFDGIQDLNAGVIRTVRDAGMRFDEDALRILRCLRFASQLGFTIEEETAKQLRMKCGLLDAIAWERKREEFIKLIGGISFHFVFQEYRDVLTYVIKEIDMLDESQYRELLNDMKCIREDGEKIGLSRLIVLLSVFPNEVRTAITSRLRFSRHDTCLILGICRIMDRIQDSANFPISLRCRYWLQAIGMDDIELLFISLEARQLMPTELLDQCWQEVRKIKELKEPFLIKHLDINGRDLQTLGIPSGPQIGFVLHRLLDEVMLGNVSNEKVQLVNQVKKWIT